MGVGTKNVGQPVNIHLLQEYASKVDMPKHEIIVLQRQKEQWAQPKKIISQ